MGTKSTQAVMLGADANAMKTVAHKIAKAWEFKQLLRAFWDRPDRTTGHAHLPDWLAHALPSALRPVQRLVRMCRKNMDNRLTYFAHRSINASAEAVNSRIQTLINQAFGDRNPARLIPDTFFQFGDLDLSSRFGR